MFISLLLSLFIPTTSVEPIVVVSDEDFEAVWLPPGWAGPWVAIPEGDQTGLGQ